MTQHRDPGDETTFEYPDASGIMRTWRPKCIRCDKTPIKISMKTAHETNFALGYSGEEPYRFPISDWGCYYCDDHAPEWAENI